MPITTHGISAEDAKLWADRKRLILSYIDQERKRVLDLVLAIDDRDFLVYCIENSWTAEEAPRARELYDQTQPEIDQGIEDLM